MGGFTVMWKAGMAVSGTGEYVGWLYQVLLLVLVVKMFTTLQSWILGFFVLYLCFVL